MEWSRAKTLLIALLLVVNVLLGFNAAVRIRERGTREDETVRRALDVVASRGVSLPEAQALAMPGSMTGYVLTRDAAAERARAEALLGACEEVQPGGGIYSFTGAAGAVTFRSGGYVEVAWNGEETPDLTSFLTPPGAVRAEVRAEEGVYGLLLDGLPVSGARLARDEQGLWSGTWVFGSVRLSEQSSVSRAAMILALGTAASQLGEQSIVSLAPACVLTALPSGDIRLTPAWRAETDGAVFHVSALSGELLGQ